MELAELKELIEILRTAGVTSYRKGDLELKLGAAPAKQAGEEVQDRDTPDISEDVERAILEGMPPGYSKMFSVQAGEAVQG